ncbi:MAG: hypothetical protein C0600_05820 [Ignavibacteria bacterium]|nr:MAG: hypothetical protein C0600_05820 [Ignavibacteria bacterium]
MFKYAMPAAIAIFIIGFVACETLDKSNPLTPDSLKRVSIGNYAVGINSDNPHDSIGMYHNSALNFAFRKSISDTGNQQNFQASFIAALEDWKDSINLYSTDWIPAISDAKDTVDNNLNRDWADYLENFSDVANYTAKELYYINRMGALGSNCSNAQEVEDSILAIETDICNDSFNTDERAAQVGISVMKHSFYYWSYLAGEDYLAKSTENLPDWLQVVFADVGGAIVGTYSFGFPYGTISGGVLTSGYWAIRNYWDELGTWISDSVHTVGGILESGLEAVIDWLFG